MNAIEAAKKNKTAAETKAEADKFVKIKAAEGERDSKALQGEGIAKQRAAIVQGLKDSIGADTSQMTPEAVSELLLITQYFDTLEKIAHSKANTVFVPQVHQDNICLAWCPCLSSSSHHAAYMEKMVLTCVDLIYAFWCATDGRQQRRRHPRRHHAGRLDVDL